jgi:hypothetical protein
MTERGGRPYPRRNPFPSYATTSLDERPADSAAGDWGIDLPTVELPAIEQLRNRLDRYLSDFAAGNADHGRVAFLHGAHGTGKTHAVLYALGPSPELPQAPQAWPYRFYVKATDDNFVALYRRLMGQLDLAALRDISLRFLGVISSEEAGRVFGAEAEARFLAQLRETPDQVYAMSEELIVEPGAVLETQAAELAGIVGGREEFQRALTFLLDPALEEPAYAWLAGRDVSADEASRLGVSGPITDAQLCRYGLQLLVSMCARIGRPVIVVLDQCERLILDRNGSLHMLNVGLLHSLIEAVPREEGMLVLVGSDDAWRALPTDFRQRIGGDNVLAATLTPDQAAELLAAYMGTVVGERVSDESLSFTYEAILALLELSGGNMRRLLQEAWEVFEQAPPGQEITTAVVDSAADRRRGRISRDEAEHAIERVLLDEGMTFDRPWRRGALQADYGVLVGAEPRVLILLMQAVFYDDEARTALDKLRQIREFRGARLAARVVLVVLGYCTPEVLGQLERAADNVFVYDGPAVAEQVRGILRHVPDHAHRMAAPERERLDEAYQALLMAARSRDEEVRALRSEVASLVSPARRDDVSVPRWRVFVSSTSPELGSFRDAACDVIRAFRYAGLECFEPVTMEDFGTQDGQTREVSASAVRGCDILAGVVGVRYGSHPVDDRTRTSYTELEYQTAVKNGLSRLMFVLNKDVADQLEQGGSQNQALADRQDQFTRRMAADACETNVTTVGQFREGLAEALRWWVEKDSFKTALVNRGEVFNQARRRLVDLGSRTGGAALVFGEPGTGKTTLIGALLADFLIRRSYAHLVGPVTVRLAEGHDAVGQARIEVASILRSLAGQRAGEPSDMAALLPVLGATPVLVVLHLETGDAAEIVDPRTLGALPGLFTWDPLRMSVLAETNNPSVRSHLARELRWPAEAVITVRDYGKVADALEQMRRDAPGVPNWPPTASTLAEALGLRPMSLRDAATYIDQHAEGSVRRAAFLIREMLDAIARGKSSWERYEALIRNQLDRLSPAARELVALVTVLHPKPAHFSDEMAVALVELSLGRDSAVRLSASKADEEGEGGQTPLRDHADRLIAELIGRGILERNPGSDLSRHQSESPELLTLGPSKRAIIQKHLPLTQDRRDQVHARAEAFYRARIGEAGGRSPDTRSRVEQDAWWDDAEEWIYHLGQTDPGQATGSYVTFFLDAFWWWDLYIPSEVGARVLAYGSRPLVRAIPGMPDIVELLTRFRDTWPREFEITLTRIYAEVAGEDTVAQQLLDFAGRGDRMVHILHELSGRLGLTELEDLFTYGAPPPGPGDPDAVPWLPAEGPAGPEDRHHLVGLICLLLAECYQHQALVGPGEPELAAAERCYKYALAHFEAEDGVGAEDDVWDPAWARYVFGEVVSRRGGDPVPLWEQASHQAQESDDIELRANIERARADHLRSRGELEGALPHYGQAVFDAMTFQVTSNMEASADQYTQAFYREICSHAAKVLAEALLADQESPQEARMAEAGRRLQVMLAPWGGSWIPDADELASALGSARPEDPVATVEAISRAAFPPGPDDAVLSDPDADYNQWVRNLVKVSPHRPGRA